MSDPVWIVDGTTEVVAETFWVNNNGDLLFGSKPEPVTRQGAYVILPPVPHRALASGTWSEVKQLF